MKKLLALIIAISLVFVFSACGNNTDENATTTSTAINTVATITEEETSTTMETTAAETTKVVETEITSETAVVTTKPAEYDLYQTLTLMPEDLLIQFSAEINEAIFRYVPYENRGESDFEFYTVLQVKVDCASQDLVITFPGSETVFPANMPEAVVSSNGQNINANYNLDLEENSAIMTGFDNGLESVVICFPDRYMSTIDMKVGEELYEVTYLNIVFNKK